jgi:hypothetical protein
MKRLLVIAVLFAVALVLLAMPANAAEKSYVATRYDVAAVVEEGGDLLVTETVTYAFYGEPFTFVFRELETDFSDGVTILDVAMDGQSLPAGTSAGRAEIRGERVTWHMTPMVDETHTFTLQYRLHGVVRQGDGGDILRFQILPTDHDFTILESETAVTFPPGVRPVGDVAIIAGSGTVTRLEDGVLIDAGQLAADTSLAIEVVFPPGSVIGEPPAWQARQLAQAEAAPYWLAAGAALFVLGNAAFWMAYRRQQPQLPATARSERVYDPPAKLPPAYAGALASTGVRPQWQHALATLFDLAERGVVEIDEKPRRSRFSSRDFTVRQLAAPGDLAPHEEALLALLFEGRHGPEEEVRFSKLQQRVTGKRWKAYEETLWQELKVAGFVSEAKLAAGRRITVVGAVLLVAGFALIPALLLGLDPGAAAVAIPFAVLLSGLAGILLGQSVKPLTAQGAQVAADWQPFENYLKRITKGKAAVTRPDIFTLYLPYAAGFGLLHNWARHFQREGVTGAPAWFHAAAGAGEDGSMGAFVALAGSASSSGGSAAGAGAAGGAAGGGAAGAG